MADPSGVPLPGSRAIKIPLYGRKSTDYSSSRRPRRSQRGSKVADRAEASDAGPSSLSSDQESPWSTSPLPSVLQGRMQAVPSPLDQVQPMRLMSTPPASGDFTQRKDKQKAHPSDSASTASHPSSSPLGPSMLSSSSYKSIHLNSHLDDPDEPPHLITYTKHSQGFTWNDELFLPSYMLGRHGDRGRRKEYDGDFGDEEHCPVAEIFVTDEEADAMMP